MIFPKSSTQNTRQAASQAKAPPNAARAERGWKSLTKKKKCEIREQQE